MSESQTPPNKPLTRRMGWVAALAAIASAAVFAGYQITAAPAAANEAEAQPLPAATARITLQDRYRATRRFPGRINAAQVSDVGFQIGGEIAEVLVGVGDRVEAGDQIARLDPQRLRLRIDELEASKAEATASLTRAEAALDRTRQLFDEGFSTRQGLDDAIAERDGLRARVDQFSRSIENAQVDFGDATLRAPFSGTIVGRYLDAGVTVNAGQAVVRLNEQGSLDAIIGVPARFARNISIGDQFEITSKDLSAMAHVKGVGDEVDLATQTVAIRMEILEDPGFIPGGLVRLELEEERNTRGAWAPALALTESYRGLWSVYVVEDVVDTVGTIARKDIEIIHIGNERVFVRGTLEDGDQVIAAAPFRFVPGQKVRITGQVDMASLDDTRAAGASASLAGGGAK